MKRNLFLVIVLVLLVVLSSTACGAKTPPPESDTPQQTDSSSIASISQSESVSPEPDPIPVGSSASVSPSSSTSSSSIQQPTSAPPPPPPQHPTPISTKTIETRVVSQESNQITVAVPQFPSLEITFTNPFPIAAKYSFVPGMAEQVKFYYTPSTTMSFNRDITLGFTDGTLGTVKFKANQPVRCADYPSGTLGVHLTVSSDGSYAVHNTLNVSVGTATLYHLICVDSIHYEANRSEGYSFLSDPDWTDGGNKWVISRPAASSNTYYDLKVSTDYGNGKIFNYTIPNATNARKLTLADEETVYPPLNAVAGETFDTYDIYAGQQISLHGTCSLYITPLRFQDGKLYDIYGIEYPDPKTLINLSYIPGEEVAPEFYDFGQGSSLQFIAKGYYLVAMIPYVAQHFDTDEITIIEEAVFSQAIVLNAI